MHRSSGYIRTALLATALVVAWIGQGLLRQEPPATLPGWVLIGVGIVLFLGLSAWTMADDPQRTPDSLAARWQRAIEQAPLAYGALAGALLFGALAFWCDVRPELQPWPALGSWFVGNLLLLVGAWRLDRRTPQPAPPPEPPEPATEQTPPPESPEPPEPPETRAPAARTPPELSPDVLPTVREPWERWELVALLLLLGVAFALRAFNIGVVPYNVSGDEASMGIEARLVLQGEITDPFATGWLSHPTLWFFLQALSLHLFGDNVGGLRMLSVLIGTLTMPVFYLLVRPLYGRTVAVTAVVLLVFFHFHIHYSRYGLNNIADPLLGLVAFSAFLHGYRHRSWLGFALAGSVLGLALNFYMGTRLLPVLLVGVLVHQLVVQPRYLWSLRWHMGVLVVGFLLGFGPLLTHFIQFPDSFGARLAIEGIVQNGFLQEQLEAGNDVTGFLLEQAHRSFGAYTVLPDSSTHYDPGIPLLTNISAVLFLFGVGLVLLRWRRIDSMLIVAWLGGTAVFGGMLLMSPPASARYITTAPVLCLLVAIAIVQVGTIVQRSLRLPPQSLHGIITALVVTISVWNVDFYFNTYTPRNSFGGLNTEVGTELGKYLQPRDEDVQVYFFGPPRMYIGFPSIIFLAPDAAGVNVFEPIGFPDQLPALQEGRTPLFVFLPERTAELNVVRSRFPEGQVREVVARSEDVQLYVLYEPTGAATRQLPTSLDELPPP